MQLGGNDVTGGTPERVQGTGGTDKERIMNIHEAAKKTEFWDNMCRMSNKQIVHRKVLHK